MTMLARSPFVLALCFLVRAVAVGDEAAPSGNVSYQGGERTSYALNDYQRLGQTLTLASRFNILWITAPSWNDNEGGFTLSLYDSPARTKLLATKQFGTFEDNATLYLYTPTPLDPRTYYWEIAERTGQTRVGLYAFRNSTYEGGSAYFDGKPDEAVDFVSGWRYSPWVGCGRRVPLTEQRRRLPLARRELPQWLWFPDPAVPSVGTRYFRFTFELPDAPRAAELLIAGDDGYQAFVNGQPVAQGSWDWPKRADVIKLLRPGRNVLAAADTNSGGPGGLIARFVVTTGTGQQLRLISQPTDNWRGWDRDEPGWQKVEFDDSQWRQCVSVGDALSDPWFPNGDVKAFSEGVFDARHIIDSLRREPPARAEVRPAGGAPRLFVNGKPVFPLIFASTGLTDFAPDFAAIGVHVTQPRYNLATVWIGPGKYDFTAWDLHLARLLYGDLKAQFLILIHLEPPLWWKQAHPEELIRYADGTGYISDEFGGTMQASFASEVWRRETTEALRAALRHFEGSPLRSRIIGYHVANGIYGEWHYFGSRYLPDVGPRMTERFRQWAKDHYRTADDVRKAWGDETGGFDQIVPPTAAQRTRMDFGLFRDPARSRFVPDYYQCLHELSSDTLLHFARVVKEETGRRVICGALYCYLLENLWIQEGGHLDPGPVLDSPDLDYLSCPYSYQGHAIDGAGNDLGSARGVGGDAAYRVLVASARLHGKLYFAEIDTATWLEFDPSLTPYGGEGTETEAGTLRALRRDVAQMIGEGVGAWFLELAPGWYADENIMADLARLRAIGVRSVDRDLSPIAEVAAVCDARSFFYSSHWEDAEAGEYDLFDSFFLDSQNRALHRLSAPVDFLYADDVARAPDHKLTVFLNAFYLTDDQIPAIRQKVCRNGNTVVWVYAPGFVGPSGLSAERMSKLIGIDLRMMTEPGPLLVEVTDPNHALTRGGEARFGVGTEHTPRFAVIDPQAITLGVWSGTNQTAFGVKHFPDWTSVYVGTAPIPPGILRNIARAAGVHLYSSRPDVVYGNASYLALVANGPGQRVVSLSRPMRRLTLAPRRGMVTDEGQCRLDLAHGDVVIWESASRKTRPKS